MTLSPAPGQVGRMQVSGQPRRFVPNSGELADRAFERAQRLQGSHVADVTGAKRPGPVGEAKGVLQFGTDGQNRGAIPSDVDRQRGVATGPAHR